MFTLTRQETDHGRMITKRKTLRHEWLLHTLQMRQQAQVVHTLGHIHRHSISGTPSLGEVANKVAPHVKVAAHIKVVAHVNRAANRVVPHVKVATHVRVAACIKVAPHSKVVHHTKESGSLTTYKSGANIKGV